MLIIFLYFNFINISVFCFQGYESGVYPVRIGFNSPIFGVKNRSFELNCMEKKSMDVKTAALVDDVAECFNGLNLYSYFSFFFSSLNSPPFFFSKILNALN